MSRRRAAKSSRRLFSHNNNLCISRLYIVDGGKLRTNLDPLIEFAIEEVLENFVRPEHDKKYFNITLTSELLDLFKKLQEKAKKEYGINRTLGELLSKVMTNSYLTKNHFSQFEFQKTATKQAEDEKKKLQKELDECLTKLIKQEGSGKHVDGISMSVTYTATPINILKIIAAQDIYLAWFFKVYGYDPSRSPTLEELCYVKNLVESMGKNNAYLKLL